MNEKYYRDTHAHYKKKINNNNSNNNKKESSYVENKNWDELYVKNISVKYEKSSYIRSKERKKLKNIQKIIMKSMKRRRYENVYSSYMIEKTRGVSFAGSTLPLASPHKQTLFKFSFYLTSYSILFTFFL